MSFRTSVCPTWKVNDFSKRISSSRTKLKNCKREHSRHGDPSIGNRVISCQRQEGLVTGCPGSDKGNEISGKAHSINQTSPEWVLMNRVLIWLAFVFKCGPQCSPRMGPEHPVVFTVVEAQCVDCNELGPTKNRSIFFTSCHQLGLFEFKLFYLTCGDYKFLKLI